MRRRSFGRWHTSKNACGAGAANLGPLAELASLGDLPLDRPFELIAAGRMPQTCPHET